jgi:hypothetical protein
MNPLSSYHRMDKESQRRPKETKLKTPKILTVHVPDTDHSMPILFESNGSSLNSTGIMAKQLPARGQTHECTHSTIMS